MSSVNLHPHFKPDGGRRSAISWGRKRKKEMITVGAIPDIGQGFVYVGVTPGGRVKVGMTSDPDRRAAELDVEMKCLMPVRPQVAKELETATLQLLGHEQGDSEWLRKPDVDAAINALHQAMNKLRKCTWVDPHLSEDEARRMRVNLAIAEAEKLEVLARPDRRTRHVSLTGHRRAFGIKAPVGSRFI